jgi:NDP-sugar pyrophosphorylase family protein
MDYVCLAAGKGTRFAGLGGYLQKCMYPLYGYPFLKYTIDALITSPRFSAERDTLTIVTGHLGEQIHAYFGDRYHGVPLRYVEQREQLGTGHAISCALEGLPEGGRAMVWLADSYFNAANFAALLDHPLPNALTLARHVCDRRHNERVDIDATGRQVTRAWQGQSPYVEIGLWKLAPELREHLFARKVDEYRFLPAVQNAIEEGVPVGALIAEEWVHLGGTEPSVLESIALVTKRMAAEQDHLLPLE